MQTALNKKPINAMKLLNVEVQAVMKMLLSENENLTYFITSHYPKVVNVVLKKKLNKITVLTKYLLCVPCRVAHARSKI